MNLASICFEVKLDKIDTKFILLLCSHSASGNRDASGLWLYPCVVNMTVQPELEIAGYATGTDIAFSLV